MSGKILSLLGAMLVVGMVFTLVPERETTIRLNDLKYKKDREELKDYINQGYWKKTIVWRHQWVKTWVEKKIYLPMWQRKWVPIEMEQWVVVHVPVPKWMKYVRGPLFVKIP